jgi:hypothetical protein
MIAAVSQTPSSVEQCTDFTERSQKKLQMTVNLYCRFSKGFPIKSECQYANFEQKTQSYEKYGLQQLEDN